MSATDPLQFLILNGPNLNLLGTRQPGIYGSQSFESCLPDLEAHFPLAKLHYRQSNVEGELINFLHEFGFDYQGIVLNAGGYTHTSVALGDAVAAIEVPVVEVHISNVFAREDFRHVSYLAPHCVGSVAGLGLGGYKAALEFLRDYASASASGSRN